ncbi:sensor histidine kinase [Microbacterium sp. NPDC057944]|uniref:sensor histidine kinase n=1 Tax=Microbacterium sp. NPDC057944 TaxID=3346286 RepID=UPI0036D761F3
MNLSRLTIRVRITGGSLLIAILISVVAGIIVYSQVARIVGEGQVRLLEGVEGQYVTAITTGDTEEMDLPGPGQFVAVIDPSGAVGVDTLPDGLSGRAEEFAAGPDGHTTVGSYVVRATTVTAGAGEWHVITATDSNAQVLNEVAALLIASIAVINIAFGAASWLIGSAALSPVSRLRRSAAALIAEPGADLLPVGPARDEIAELAETLNELVVQLRSSAERERQIVSDASHEFRTPLAIIQTRLELAQREATSLEDMRRDVAAAQQTVARLTSLATSLLELSRIDAQQTAGSASVDRLAEEMADAADRWRLRVADRAIRVDYADETARPTALVAVSVEDFGRLCDNLIGNAVNAIGREGAIELVLSDDGGGVVLSVSDDGGGMDAGFAPSALDRFARQSDARTRGGAGLGLSIVAGIAANASGRVSLVNTPGEGLRVDVHLALAHDAAPRH